MKIRWRLKYDELWLKFKNNEFKFENALEVIFDKNKFNTREIKSGSKLLNIIEDNGYAVHRKAEYDQRVMVYRLLNPEKISNAKAIFDKVHRIEKFTVIDLINEANKSAGWNYMFIKDSAVGFYTNYYRSVDVHHLSVLKEESDGWVSLLKIAGFPIILDNVIINEQKKGKAVFLHTDLDIRKNQFGKENYQLPQYTIIECFKDNDLQSALSILIMQRGKLNWSALTDLTRYNGLINTLGFSLECINKEAGKQIFSQKLTKKIKPRKEIEIIREAVGEITINPEYKKLEENWNTKCRQASIFKKIVEDLVR